MLTRKAKKNQEEAAYKPTDGECTAMKKFIARNAAKPAVRVKVSKNGGHQLETDHPNKLVGEALLMDVFGTANGEFLNGIIGQLANLLPGQEIDDRQLNFIVSIVQGIEPRDQIEAMLAAQMAAVHLASMTFANRLACVEYLQQQDSAERAFNKLTRTFATQMETLKRYRTGGEQKVTVQHVSVAEGGQAIVGNVTQTAQRNNGQEKPAPSPPALTHAKIPPMPVLDEKKEQAPISMRRK